MPFIIGYKSAYVILIVGNFLVELYLVNIAGYKNYVGSPKLSCSIVLLINLFNLYRILTRNAGKGVLICEKCISISRMIMIFLVSTVILGQFFMFSPVKGSLWSPIFSLYLKTPSSYGLYLFYSILIILFALEIYYFRLLKKFKNELASKLK